MNSKDILLQTPVFVIPGNPIPLKRHRHKIVNGKSRTYDPQKAEKLYYGLLLKQQISVLPFSGIFPLSGPVHMTLRFLMPIPKRHKLHQVHGMPHYYKPDLDNLIKFISDCANGILYKDDSQISSISSIKIYSKDNPRTEITITKYKDKNER